MGKSRNGTGAAKLQLRVVRLLDTGNWFATIETRIRISPTRYRVPDVCVYEHEPEEQSFQTAPWKAGCCESLKTITTSVARIFGFWIRGVERLIGSTEHP